MKKIFTFMLVFVLLFAVGCGAVSDADTDLGHSKSYDEKELEDAAHQINKHFRAMYNGCTLLTVKYDGDATAKDNLDYCRELEPDKDYVDCVVFTSSFETSEHCDTTLEPNQTYEDWQWYLAREKGGEWELVMEGQG